MAKISIEINDNDFDVGMLIANLASQKGVTVNIFTSEEDIQDSSNLSLNDDGAVVIGASGTETPKVKTTDTNELTQEEMLTKLSSLSGDEQTEYGGIIHFEHGVTWADIGRHLSVRSDTFYRRWKALGQKQARKESELND